MATDEELIAAVASGDGRRLEELCRRWERPLYQLIARHTGGRDVEDLYQETWLRVVRAARRFDPGRRFSTWLFQIAVNLCRDWRRRPPPEPVDTADAEARLPGRPGGGAGARRPGGRARGGARPRAAAGARGARARRRRATPRPQRAPGRLADLRPRARGRAAAAARDPAPRLLPGAVRLRPPHRDPPHRARRLPRVQLCRDARPPARAHLRRHPDLRRAPGTPAPPGEPCLTSGPSAARTVPRRSVPRP